MWNVFKGSFYFTNTPTVERSSFRVKFLNLLCLLYFVFGVKFVYLLKWKGKPPVFLLNFMGKHHKFLNLSAPSKRSNPEFISWDLKVQWAQYSTVPFIGFVANKMRVCDFYNILQKIFKIFE